MKIIFWFCLALVGYTYIGYGLVLFLLIRLKRYLQPHRKQKEASHYPEIAFVVAAYNERDWIEEKISNSLALDYPSDKITFIFVTDGSNDGTDQLVTNYPWPKTVRRALFHQDKRQGKIAAVNRIMPHITSPITVYSDANTIINSKAIRHIVRHYEKPHIGGVAGEKRIRVESMAQASSAGEGLYWNYESKLKKWDSELYSVVGAAGELFSIRTSLYEPVPKDTIIEDFYLTLRIAQRGYRVAYEPDAYAVETASASVKEELKRKIRIAAGGLQAIYRLRGLLNIFKYKTLSFQYISHRVLRWTIAPLALPVILLANIYLAVTEGGWYRSLLVLQVLFYTFAFAGYLLERRRIKVKLLFIPFYFCMMNYAVFRGFARIITGRQSVLWERAKRAK